jgi:hypothetical protein
MGSLTDAGLALLVVLLLLLAAAAAAAAATLSALAFSVKAARAMSPSKSICHSDTKFEQKEDASNWFVFVTFIS